MPTPDDTPALFGPDDYNATPEAISDAIREFEEQQAADSDGVAIGLPGGGVAAQESAVTDAAPETADATTDGDLPATATAASLPSTIEDEIAAAEALLTPEQLAARRAAQVSPFEQRTVPRIDRSTLERFANCPQQGVLMRRMLRPPVAKIADEGIMAHELISSVMRDYIEHGAEWRIGDVIAAIDRATHESRPDVQPMLVEMMRASRYSLASMIAELSPANILGFDGGPVDLLTNRSGQIAAEFSHPVNWIGTLELDLFYKTPAPTVIEVVDYKTGWKTWSPATIYKTFQFRFAALIIFLNYPEVEEVHFVVWSPRTGGRSQPVVFSRRKSFEEILAQVQEAAVAYFRFHKADPDDVPAYPNEDKCRFCPAVAACKLAHKDAADIDDSPEAFVDRMFVMQAALDDMAKTATAYVKRIGRDIVSPNGPAFGFDKPKRKTYPKATLYGTMAAKRGESDDATETAEE